MKIKEHNTQGKMNLQYKVPYVVYGNSMGWVKFALTRKNEANTVLCFVVLHATFMKASKWWRDYCIRGVPI